MSTEAFYVLANNYFQPTSVGSYLLPGHVGALSLTVAFGTMLALVSSISSRVFFCIGSLRAGGREGHSHCGGQPKIRAGQFHTTKVTLRCQTNNHNNPPTQNFQAFPRQIKRLEALVSQAAQVLNYRSKTHLHLITNAACSEPLLTYYGCQNLINLSSSATGI